MSDLYVMDACALLAFFNDEIGADLVDNILTQANGGTAKITMHNLNLLEVYYDTYRKYGEERAEREFETILQLPITINTEITKTLFKKAGRLKATYKISLADSIAVAQAAILGAKLLTSDHHELDVVEEKEPIEIVWIR
ncbi:MAG: type II toxin-antitoxin system VapC family toxin [Turicibacter sp.]|nr:type II toxin-antitoxin system VapC family toxin [Turicibacter sp.]